jgi:hypothetical protein
MLQKIFVAAEAIIGLLAAFVIGFLPPVATGLGALPLFGNGCGTNCGTSGSPSICIWRRARRLPHRT